MKVIPQYQTRWIVAHDHADVLRIDRACYPEGARLRPSDLDEMTRRHIGCLTFDERERTTGYSIYGLSDDCIQLLRIGVAPAYRRCGYGSTLVNRLKRRVISTIIKRKRVEALVDGRQVACQLLLSKCGFIGSPVPNTDTIRFRYTLDMEGF